MWICWLIKKTVNLICCNHFMMFQCFIITLVHTPCPSTSHPVLPQKDLPLTELSSDTFFRSASVCDGNPLGIKHCWPKQFQSSHGKIMCKWVRKQRADPLELWYVISELFFRLPPWKKKQFVHGWISMSYSTVSGWTKTSGTCARRVRNAWPRAGADFSGAATGPGITAQLTPGTSGNRDR